MGFVGFMSSAAGRWTRAGAGGALIAAGLVAGGGWLWLLAPGAVFVAVGAFDVCLLAPLAGLPFSGRKVRARAA